MFFLKKTIAAMLLPPTFPLILLLAGLVLLSFSRRQRLARILLWSGTAALLLLATPITAHVLSLAANGTSVVDLEAARRAQAIVILGGGIRRDAAEYGTDAPSWMSLERIRYGARLGRETGLPVLATGGVVLGGDPESAVMKRVLEQEWSVPVRWTEEHSRNTHENAVNTATMLLPQGIRRIVLVTHGFHMLRAKAEFEAAGFEVVPAATGLPRIMVIDEPGYFLPNAGTLQSSYYALHELLGYLAFRLSGR